MKKPDKLPMHTPSLANEKFTTLTKLFPNAVTETIDENGAVVRAIDADVLAQEINTHVVSGREERYQFTWPEKKKSMLLANAAIAAALRPCRKESVDFDNTENLYIEGDNLDVLKLLRETYLNKVKMIYIDPPYNTGNDRLYKDDYAEETVGFRYRDGQYDEQGKRMVKNFDSNGRFHTDWLNMIYPRLLISKDLLTNDGVIFISIDDNEIDNLKKLCNELFGEKNFIAQFVWERAFSPKNDACYVSNSHDYVLMYARTLNKFTIGQLERSKATESRYKNLDADPRGKWTSGDLSVKTYNVNMDYEIITPSGRKVKPPHGACWRVSKGRFAELVDDKRIWFGETGNNVPRLKRFLSEIKDGVVPTSILFYKEVGHSQEGRQEFKTLFGGKGYFDSPKPVRLLKHLLKIANLKANDIIMDFFSGSSTSAQAIMELNAEDGEHRKFIMVQFPEVTPKDSLECREGYFNVAEIGKERIRRAGKKINKENPSTTRDIDVGFRVLKLDSTNMKEVYYTPEKYAQMNYTIEGFADNIKPDRTDEDLLFQVMLDLGIPLSAKIRQEGRTFYVEENYLIACFGKVDTDLITDIAKKKPYYAVFRDSSFADDSALVNFEQIFATYSPATTRKVL